VEIGSDEAIETKIIVRMKDGAKRATINYGPMTLQPKAMANVPSLMMKKPCTDCYITALQATLKYMDGSVANADTGVWSVIVIFCLGSAATNHLTGSTTWYRRTMVASSSQVATNVPPHV